MLHDSASLDSFKAVIYAQNWPEVSSVKRMGGHRGPDALSQVPTALHSWTVAHWGSFHRYWSSHWVDGLLWCSAALPSTLSRLCRGTSNLSAACIHVLPWRSSMTSAPRLAAVVLFIFAPYRHQDINTFQVVFNWFKMRLYGLNLQSDWFCPHNPKCDPIY